MSSLEINTNSINKNNLSEKLIEDSKIVQLEIEQPSNINSLDNKKIIIHLLNLILNLNYFIQIIVLIHLHFGGCGKY